MASQVERWPPERGTRNPTPCWEWHNSSLWHWQKGLRCATCDICPTVVKWGMRVLFCPFCPDKKWQHYANRHRSVHISRLQCIAARSRWVHQATRCCGQAGLGQLRGKQTAAPSGRQREGGQSPRTSWNKIMRFRLGMPTRFSYVDPAGTPVVPSRDCKTLHRVDRSRCCKIGIALIPDLICKARETIWILKLPLYYHPIHL